MSRLPGFNFIFHSIRQGGGMERYVLDLIAYAATKGVPVRVVTRKLAWPDAPSEHVEFVVIRDQTPFSRLNNYLFENRALTRCNLDWPTIAVSRVPGAQLAIVGGTHLAHLVDRGKKHYGFFDRAMIRRERALYHGARKIISHSARVAGEIVEHYGIAQEKVVTLYPPVDTAKFSLAARHSRDQLRQSLGVEPDQMLLLFPSNNHVLKGSDLILSALSACSPRYRLAVAGKNPLDAKGVINLGFRQDMPELYAAADAVILASHYEAFGLVGPEAILCCTPVIFSTTVGAVEVLSQTACMSFQRNTRALQQALEEALNRFDNDTLKIKDPSSHILYPYTLAQHFDSLFAMLDLPQK